MPESTTDCRTEEGITVALIDGIIAQARILANRDLTTPAVIEALKGFSLDEDTKRLFKLGLAARMKYRKI